MGPSILEANPGQNTKLGGPGPNSPVLTTCLYFQFNGHKKRERMQNQGVQMISHPGLCLRLSPTTQPITESVATSSRGVQADSKSH